MKFFVSYSRSVQDKVREIIAALRDEGEEVWWDQDLRAGQDWWATILDNIEQCQVCLFFVSEKSVQSPYCMEELRYALARNRLVLPYVMDAPASYTIPPEIMKGRIQFELYSGKPSHLKDRIRTTCKGIDWSQYKDRFAVRPPEPNTGASNLADRLAKAIALAQEGVFEGAVEGFTDVAHNDHATFGEFCHIWIEKINRYKEVVGLATHASMKRLALPKWAAFLKQYAEDEAFDPLGVEDKLAIKSTSPANAAVSDVLQKVYSLIEEVRKAHIKNEPFGADPYLYALGDMGEVAVIPILALLQDESALMRVSAINLLGNIGDERAIEPIIGMLQDTDADVRWAACHMLARFEDKQAVEPLIGMLKDPQADVRDMAAAALAVFEDLRAVAPLMATLKDENEKVRISGARALGELKDPRTVKALELLLDDDSERVRKAAQESLDRLNSFLTAAAEWRTEGLLRELRTTNSRQTRDALREEIKSIGAPALKPLIMALKESTDDIKRFAADVLSTLGDTRAVEPLIAATKDPNGDVRRFAVEGLGKFGDGRALDPLIAALQDDDTDVKRSAARSLGDLGDKRAVDPLIVALHDRDEDMRGSVARVLGRLGDTRAVAALTQALQDESEFVRTRAQEALEDISKT